MPFSLGLHLTACLHSVSLIREPMRILIVCMHKLTGIGPVVDGSFVPDLPGKLLLEGKFAKDVKVMVGHNANEVCPDSLNCIVFFF